MSYIGKKVKINASDYTESEGVVGQNGTILKERPETYPYDFKIKLENGNDDLFFEGEIEFIQENKIECNEEQLINPKDHALVFVQTGFKNDWVLYQDGVEVKGLKSVEISADIEYPTEHVLKLVTGATKQ
jgi:hypothetical protein